MIDLGARTMVLWIPESDRDPDPDRARRRWESALTALEALIPGLGSDAVGVCTARARGPARYYGSETSAARTLLSTAVEHGFASARAGIASGRFTAEQAARAAADADWVSAPEPGIRLVSDEDTGRFLASIPVAAVADAELAETLLGLGVRTLGAFAALPADAVLERFGRSGADAHRLARGLEPMRAAAGPTPSWRGEHRTMLGFESPLDDTDRLAFACRAHAEEFVDGLARHGLVCTELRVELIDDIDANHERTWAHPVRFTAADVVNRIRWQAAAVPRDGERGGAGIIEVRLIAARIARASDHEPGLWSTAPDERIHHHLTRVQNLVGYEGVGTGELLGGRSSGDRQRMVPWSSPTGTGFRARTRDGPWPGRITGPPPSIVFAEAPPVSLLDAHGLTVGIDDEDLLASPPARLRLAGAAGTAAGAGSYEVRAWSSPWPLRERHWTGPEHATPARYRLQVLLGNGDAWLLRYEESGTPGAAGRWVAEGRYY